MPSKFAAKLKAAGHSLKETKPSHEHDDTGTTPMSDVGLLATPNQERMSKLRSPSRLSDWLQSVEDGYFSQRHKIRRRVHPYYLEKPMEGKSAPFLTKFVERLTDLAVKSLSPQDPPRSQES
jgi:hypothetical protein